MWVGFKVELGWCNVINGSFGLFWDSKFKV